MSTIKIITDTGSDLLPEEAAACGIHLIPFPLFIDGTEYQSGIEVSPERFYQLQAACKEFPQTAQITPQQYVDIFKQYEADYTDVICITLSSKASGTYNSACLAKQMLQEDGSPLTVHVMDSMGFAYMYAYAAIEGARLAKEGKDVEEVKARIQDILEHYQVLAAVETLEYLKQGGRINAATMFVGNLLDIHPLINIQKGIIENVDKIRGSKRLIAKLSAKIGEQRDADSDDPLILIHANCPEKAEQLKAQVEADFAPKNIWVKDIGSIIGIHTGPGLVGAFFRIKERRP